MTISGNWNAPPDASIVSEIAPPSGGDWYLVGVMAVNPLPETANAGLDQSVHTMHPFGLLPQVYDWIDNFINQASSDGMIVYYVGIWGSFSLNQYNIIVAYGPSS